MVQWKVEKKSLDMKEYGQIDLVDLNLFFKKVNDLINLGGIPLCKKYTRRQINLHQNLVPYGSHPLIYANKNLMGATRGEKNKNNLKKGNHFSLNDLLIADQEGKKRKGKIPCHRKYLSSGRQQKILGKRKG